jgi:hypothetical protein
MSSRGAADARRASGLLLAFVLVVSQASAWFHAVAITHVTCLEHGEAMHAAPRDAARSERSQGLRQANGQAQPQPDVRADLAAASGHDHCANAALLRWRDVALTAPASLAPLAVAPRVLTFASARDGAHGAVVYLLAPKTSPPIASA